MQEKTARERVLKKIRKALIQREQDTFLPQLDFDSDVFSRSEEPLPVIFAETFVGNDGRFVYCQSKQEFLEEFFALSKSKNWQNVVCFEEGIDSLFRDSGISYLTSEPDMENLEVGITSCDSLIARVGGIMVTSIKNKSRMLSIFPPVHIVVAYSHQLVYDIKDALELIKTSYDQFPSMVSIIAGPSRTADIEKTLVLGAHGPKELYLFLIDEEY
jgi:L-lactate dehydrogenase complex protein LldG